MRKWYHTSIVKGSSNETALKFLARLDGHSEKVAKDVYCASNPNQDAEHSKHLVEVMLNPPVPWPSASLLNAIDDDEHYEAMIAKFKRSFNADDDESDDEDGEAAGVDRPVSLPDDQPLEALVKGTPPRNAPNDPAATPAKSNSTLDKFMKKGMAPELLPTPPSKKRKRVLMTDEQKEWVVEEALNWSGGVPVVPPKDWFPELQAKGIRMGTMTADNSAEGMRTFLRNHFS